MKSLLLLLSTVLFAGFTLSCQEQAQRDLPKPNGFVRINATLQEYSESQPWDRKEPVNRSGLGTVLEGGLILTTSEMVSHHVYLEIESTDGIYKIPARVVAEDPGANLALIAPVNESDSTFLSDLTPLALSDPLELGAQVETWQFEDNGQPTITKTNITAVDVTLTSPVGQPFFCYLLKGSLQNASSSYTVPVLSGGKLVGVLTSYDSQDQISEVIASEIIARFVQDALDGPYKGFASLGIAGSTTEGVHFRNWLKLAEEEGGIYITKVSKNSAAAAAGLKVGDVLLSVNGNHFDRKGYYQDERYGKLSWTHLIRGRSSIGENIDLEIKRNGQRETISATLGSPPKPLVDYADPTRGPQYLIKGGVIFQELTRNYLYAHGKNWTMRAPLNLLDVYYNSERYEADHDEVIVITGVIPSQVTVGYEGVRNGIVKEVNGQTIRQFRDLEAALQSPSEGRHEIILSESPYQLYLEVEGASQVDEALLSQGLSALSRINPEDLAQSQSTGESSTVQ